MSSDQVLARDAPREPADGFPLGEAAVQRSLDAARAADRAGLCIAVLDIVAVLAAGGVRRALLHAAGQTGVLVRDRRVPADEVDQALTQLADRSLLTLSPDGQTVSMPVPVAQLVRAGLARAAPLTTVCRAAASTLEAQADALARSPDEATSRDIPEQVAALRKNAGPAAESDEQLAVALLRLRSWALYQLIERGGSAPQVIEVGEPLIAELERVLGPDHPDTLHARDSLAAAYQAAGRAAEAILLFEHILVARQRILGPKHPDTLTSQNNLAATYQDAGRFAEAILLFKLTLAARECLFGADHDSTLNSRANLAAAFRATGRVSEAIPLLEQTVAGREHVLSADHPDVQAARDNLTAARDEKDWTDDTVRLVLLAGPPPPAVEQESAEEPSAEQEPAEEPVPGPMESSAAPSSDDAAPEPLPESPVAPVDEEKLSAQPATVELSAPELTPPAEGPPAAAATVELSAAVAAAETGDQPPLEPAPVPGPELEPEVRQDVLEPTLPAEEPPVAVVAAEPSAPPAAEEPPSTAAPLRAVPWWQLRKRAIKSRPEPVSVPEPEPELQASQDASEPTPPAEEPRASRAVVEPSAAPADGEEPAAVAAAETGDQVPPEPVSAPEPETQPQDVSEPTPPAEAPPASQAAEEPLAAAAVEEAAAEKPPDPPLPEEPPAVAAEVEPAAAPADGEEPAAVAAAETGDQASPEPAQVPDREPEQDVSEPTPLAEEPSAAAHPEEPPAPSVEEPAAEEPPDAPPAEEPPAVPAAEEPSAPPARQWPPPARDRPARRRRRVPSLVAAVVIVLAAGGVAGFLSRPHAGHSGHSSAASHSGGSQRLSAASQLAAVWVAQQVAASTIVACDPLMCSALEAQGVAAANLVVLRADATSPLGAQVIVVTPAVRSQFGSRVDSVYAPSVIAGFGSGPGQVSVQVVAKGGPVVYLTALREDVAARKAAGAQLLANKHIQASAEARAQLAAGAVDARLLIMLPALAAVHPIQVLAFGGPAPGAGPGVPLCSAELSGSGHAASMSDVNYLRWLTSFIGTQLVPFAGSMSVLQEAGQPIVRVVFAQPSPLGLLSHT